MASGPAAQQQPYPGREREMHPRPRSGMENYRGSGKLAGRRALITGGDSRIGRAVGIAFAKEGADVAFSYRDTHECPDVDDTRARIEREGRRAASFAVDHATEEGSRLAVQSAVEALGGLDLLVNNVAYQHPLEQLEELTTEQWDLTFRTNIHSYFWTIRAALPHLGDGAAIINTASINGLRGNRTLIDYAATKGAVLALTYSLAQALQERGIRVNSVAPGPVWTPLIPATMPPDRVEGFGEQAPMGRAAQPDEIAPSYVFLASGQLSSYYSGEVLAPIGGETLPG